MLYGTVWMFFHSSVLRCLSCIALHETLKLVIFFNYFLGRYLLLIILNLLGARTFVRGKRNYSGFCFSEGRETREFRNSNTDAQRGAEYGERRGRGGMRGMSRGRGGPRGRGGYDNRGKREFDRQSGSDKT